MTVDPITLEVARNRFTAIADEMGAVLRRTSLSPNIKERADCSAAVFNARGEMLAQAEHIPVHLGSMPASVLACLEAFDPEPGVHYAVNDPFAGGTHLNDLTIVAPVFVDSQLVAWVANRAHHADVGGEAPGSMPAHATTVDQEGHRVAPTVAVRSTAFLSLARALYSFSSWDGTASTHAISKTPPRTRRTPRDLRYCRHARFAGEPYAPRRGPAMPFSYLLRANCRIRR